MIAYAESSAVLAWILGEPRGEEARRLLADAERVVSSTLTAVECARTLARGVATSRLDRARELVALQLMGAASATWVTHEVTGQVLARARLRFPVGPVRTLDALHLSTALVFQAEDPALLLVTLDDRIRQNGEALGMVVGP